MALALALAPAAWAEPKWVEAAGVARAEPGEGPGGPGRQAALRAALQEAVLQVAVELLAAAETAPGKPPPDPAAMAEKAGRALGADPTVFVARFQVREDRGVQPKLLLADPEAKAEYQLVVMAEVDVAKVRQRVGARAAPPSGAGDAAPPSASAPAPGAAPATGPGEVSTVEVEVEQVSAYREYAAIRSALLGTLGAQSAQPVEFSRNRFVLRVESAIPAAALPAELTRALGAEVALEPLAEAPEGRVRFRVRSAPLALPAPGGLTP